MAVPLDEIRLLTADEVLAMVGAGVLGEDERLELWEGVLVRMSPQGDDHMEALGRLTRTLVYRYGDGATVFCQPTLRFSSPFELREPDFAVVLDADYEGGPRPRDTVLLIEVAVTSQARDQRKLVLYAIEGVGEVWLVDVRRRVVEVHRAPQPGGRYEEHTLVGPDAELPLPGTDATIPAAVCFPRERG